MSKKCTKNNKDNSSEEFVYCELRHCKHRECLRHNVNTPFNKIILRRKFKPDENWNCKNMEL